MNALKLSLLAYRSAIIFRNFFFFLTLITPLLSDTKQMEIMKFLGLEVRNMRVKNMFCDSCWSSSWVKKVI